MKGVKNMELIHVKNLSKTFKVNYRNGGLKASIKSFFKREYKYIEAVKDISFDIKKGEIVGYIGPNGAGKSTTIKMLSGILIPDKGEIIIDDKVPYKDRINFAKEIGVVFGQRSNLWWDIPVEDSFDLLKDIYQIPEEQYQQKKDELVQLLELEDIIKIPVRNLSLGQRMRCEIAAALLHSPKILFLDEPTIGLDAKSKVVVREFIKKINKTTSVTVILTTHDMADIEYLATRIILIGKGTILYDGTIKKIKKVFDAEKIIKVASNNNLSKIKLNGIISNHITDQNIYTFKINTEKLPLSKFIKELSKYDINDVDVENQNIDDIILKLYEEYL